MNPVDVIPEGVFRKHLAMKLHTMRIHESVCTGSAKERIRFLAQRETQGHRSTGAG